TGRATSTTSAMPSNQGQPSARSRSGGVLVTSVTTRPMNQGTALSLSATSNSTTNSAANSHLACRAKCHRKASRLGGGSGCSGGAVGVKNRSKRDNIAVGYRPLVARVNRACINWACGIGAPVNGRAHRRLVYGVIAAAARITTELLTFSPAPARVIVQMSAQQRVCHGGGPHQAKRHGGFCHRAVCVDRRRDACSGGDFPYASGHDDGRISAGRSDRHAGAHHCR